MIGAEVKLYIAGQQQGLAQPTGGSPMMYWPGGYAVFTATSSNWNAGSVSLQYLGPDGTTLVSVGSGTNLSTNGNGLAYLPACLVTATVSGSPTALHASLARVPQ